MLTLNMLSVYCCMITKGDVGVKPSGEARMEKLVLPFWNERKTHKRGSQKFS